MDMEIIKILSNLSGPGRTVLAKIRAVRIIWVSIGRGQFYCDYR